MLLVLAILPFHARTSGAVTFDTAASCIGQREALPPGAGSTWLNDVSGVSSTAVWAVGWETSDAPRPLVVQRTEAGWHKQPVPAVWDGELNAVSARTSKDVWAAGFHRRDGTGLLPLAMHFDGAEWSITAVPPRLAATLYDVVSTGPGAAWAVGTSGGDTSRPVLLRYSASRWTRVKPPSLPPRGYLAGLDRAGAGTGIVAVGGYPDSTGNQPLVLSFDGNRWSREVLRDASNAHLSDVEGGIAVGVSEDAVDGDPVVW